MIEYAEDVSEDEIAEYSGQVGSCSLQGRDGYRGEGDQGQGTHPQARTAGVDLVQ